MDSRKRLEDYLKYLDNQKYRITPKQGKIIDVRHKPIDSYNANLIRECIEKYKAKPTQPSYRRLYDVAGRLVSIVRMVGKPLDKFTEEDIQKMNVEMRERSFSCPEDYREALKNFFKLKDKKKYFELLESDFLSERGRKIEKILVDPDKFFTQEECERYLQESIKHSERQRAFASIWLTAGLRPQEFRVLKKEHIEFLEDKVLIRVPKVKTKKRIIVLEGNEAKMVEENLKPYLFSIGVNDSLFPINWSSLNVIHKRVCRRANIPKNKDWKLYCGRKMCLTRFYNTLGLVKATQMAGHTQGSQIMKHYVGLTEEQMIGSNKIVKIQNKVCPNPSCRIENQAHLSQCVSCGSPLDQEQFKEVYEKRINEINKTNLELLRSELKGIVLETLISSR